MYKMQQVQVYVESCKVGKKNLYFIFPFLKQSNSQFDKNSQFYLVF